MTEYNGLVYDLDETLYHSLPGLSSTGAKKILRSPAHFQHYINNKEAPKSAFDLGSAVHTKVLGTGSDIAVYPDGEGHETFEFEGVELGNVLATNGAVSTKAAKAFEADARDRGLIPVKRVVSRVVDRMVESVLSNQTARALLEGGHPEVSMFATDPDTQVALRGRIDYLGKRIADLKTTAGESSESGFAKHVFNLGYEVQFGQYEHTYELITGERPPWLFIVVENEAPYLTGVHVLSEDAQQIGRDKARAARERYARARDTNNWGGYTNRNGGPIGIIDVPVYAVYEYQDKFQENAA